MLKLSDIQKHACITTLCEQTCMDCRPPFFTRSRRTWFFIRYLKNVFHINFSFFLSLSSFYPYALHSILPRVYRDRPSVSISTILTFLKLQKTLTHFCSSYLDMTSKNSTRKLYNKILVLEKMHQY